MPAKQFIFQNLINLAIKFCALGLGIFTTRWVIQNFSSAEFASYNLIVAFNQVMLQIIDFGIPTLIHKYFTNEKDPQLLRKIWKSFLIFRFSTYFLALLFILVAYPLSQTDNLLWIIGLFSAQFVLLADNSFRSVYDSLGRSWVFSLTDLLGKAVLTAVLFIVVRWWPEESPVIWLFIFASLGAYLLAYFLDWLILRSKVAGGNFDKTVLQQNIGAVGYLSVSTVIVALFLNVDKLYLGYFGWGEEVINGYSVGYKLLELVSVVPGLVVPPLASFLKNRLDVHETTKDQPLSKSFYIFLAAALGLGLACSLGMLIVGPFVVQIIDPEGKYPLAFEALKILSFSVLPMIPMLLMRTLIIFYGKEKYELISVGVLCVTVNILYWLLIPQFGLVGAALATVATYIIDLGVKGYLLFRTKPELFKLKIAAGN